MMSPSTQKRLAGAFAVLSLSLLTLGCDDDYDEHRHHHPRHTERQDRERDREHHRRHRPNEEHRRHRDENKNNHRRQRDENGQHTQRRGDGQPYRRRPASAFVGAYSAVALNDAVAAKGTTFPLDVVQKDDTSLALVLPSGKQYPIRFDEETGTGTIAGGSLSPHGEDMFLYRDAKGGLWLIEKK